MFVELDILYILDILNILDLLDILDTLDILDILDTLDILDILDKHHLFQSHPSKSRRSITSGLRSHGHKNLNYRNWSQLRRNFLFGTLPLPQSTQSYFLISFPN